MTASRRARSLLARFAHVGSHALVLGALTASLASCRDQETQDIPNRVLDRPTDVALICAEVVCVDADGDGFTTDAECETQALPLSTCARDIGTCTSDNPHLVGFVANSERNEIAMFTKCGNRLVDMSPDVPGYNFIPAGVLPTALSASADGCRVVSANVGSCDLSVLEASKLASVGLGRPLEVDEPSELVSTLAPQRFDIGLGQWVPLGARPSEVLPVPRALTQAPGLGLDTPLTGVCDPRQRASAYVSFPTCNLVAEVDLLTGHVLQSRQFVGEANGEVMVVDSGITPQCPVECPAQFSAVAEFGGGVPAGLPFIDQAGPFPQALELALEPTPPNEETDPTDPNTDQSSTGGFDAADAAVEGQSLFVGGLGSDILFEIRIADSGIWEATENQLRLSEASGIKRIRVSPAVNAPVFGAGGFSQFLYVIAGDGSTRVVGRAIPGPIDAIGVECDTQIDPNVVPVGADLACIPVSDAPIEGPPSERRGFARGPGIRPGNNEEITDWMFRKVYGNGDGLGLFAEAGTVAVGVTSGARGVYVMINQRRASGETTVEDLAGIGSDPANLMDVRLFPHSLWPDPGFDTLLGLPRVVDEPPGRSSLTGATSFLSPTLRRIDAAYATDDRASAQLNVVADLDQLGVNFYEQDVARIAVHDYRQWFASNWSFEWEGPIPGTQSSTGRIACANPGWEGGTCLPSQPDDARLLDATANFCDDGVLAGDKLVIAGCTDDRGCGDGRRCLRETAVGGESRGICISSQAYTERATELRQICRNFISDPCGEAHREFTITRAFQDELWIQSMDQPLMSYVQSATTPCPSGSNNQLVEGSCECLPGYSEAACPGTPDPDALDCCFDSTILVPPPAPLIEAEDRFICSATQPEEGCTIDQECRDVLGDEQPWSCIEGRCRRPCEDADECVFRRLPGPTCFSEFLTYQVALRNQFRVAGNVGFISELVEVDPQTGECRETKDPQRSRLMTSRLPLPRSDSPDDPEWLAIPACASDTVEPTDANPCRITASRSLAAKFHLFEYEGEEVSALRFSNPLFSVVLDLSSLELLTRDVPGTTEQSWPAEFARFLRSRIPRAYRQEVRLDSGYRQFFDFLTLEGRPVTLPLRIIPGPQDEVAYIVDGSGPGSSSSIRGQVIRVFLTDQIASDQAFIGVR